MGQVVVRVIQYALSAILVVTSLTMAYSMKVVMPLLMLAPILALLFPPFRDWIKVKTNVAVPMVHAVWVSLLLWFVQAMVIVAVAPETKKVANVKKDAAAQQKTADAHKAMRDKFSSDKDGVLAEIQRLLDEGRAREALALASKYTTAGASDLELARLKDKANTAILRADLENIDKLPTERKVRIYEALMKAEPWAQRDYEEPLKAAQEQLTREKEAIAREQNTRALQESAKNQFSAWDGSHREVESAIKAGMRNPASYEHVKTWYHVDGNVIMVHTTYRGTNAFGGVVTNSAKAVVSPEGKVLALSNL